MDEIWIVAANAGRARFFAQEKASDPLREVEDLVNPAVRLRTSETEHERIGPTSAGKSMHNTGGALPNKNYEPPQTPEEHSNELFARSVCAYLLQASHDNKFKRFGVTAAPQFLGLLRQLMDPQLKQACSFEINKDYTESNPRDLKEQIDQQQAKQQE
jgi:protein required for attachment to host cells